jgi:hypothetical protein
VTTLAPQCPRAVARLLTVAEFGHAQWFFGNVYETIGWIPDRLADRGDLTVPDDEPVNLRAMLQPGSPVRYWLPVGPITMAATVGALLAGWNNPPSRRGLLMCAVGTIGSALVTAYTVHNINVKLIFREQRRTEEQEELLGRWYRLNAMRIVATGVAWIGAQRARSALW